MGHLTDHALKYNKRTHYIGTTQLVGAVAEEWSAVPRNHAQMA